MRTFAATDGGAGVELALKTYGDDVFVLEQRLRNGCAHTQVSDLPCNVRREGGQSLVIGGSSLVMLEGREGNPL